MNNSRYNALTEKDIPYMMDCQEVVTFGELKRQIRLLARRYSKMGKLNRTALYRYYKLASRVYLND